VGFDHPAGHEHCFLEFLSLGIRSSQPYKNLEGQACRAVGGRDKLCPLNNSLRLYKDPTHMFP